MAAVGAPQRERPLFELGRRLFYDADLSADGTLSCASCHEQRHAFADSVATRPGVTGAPGRRNAPGLFNLVRRTSLTWADPRITTLEQQVATPLFGTHPIEMGMGHREAEVIDRLRRNPCYPRLFIRAFGTPVIEQARIATAISAFERRLISDDAPIDQARLPDAARPGAAIFARDCASCHAGPDFTDDRFHRIDTANATGDDGLAEITGLPADRGRFRTPGLRNVAVTAPYFHDGRSPTLEAALQRHGIEGAKTKALIPFLSQLTGQRLLVAQNLSRPAPQCR